MLIFCQEEPKNMGAYSYVRPRFATALRMLQPGGNSSSNVAALPHSSLSPPRELVYRGRTVAASATASMREHVRETRDIVASIIY